MNNTRILKVIVVPALVLAALYAFLAFRPSSGSRISSPSYTGRGDYQRYEAQHSTLDASAQASRPSIGMGDLQSLEVQQFIPDTGGQGNNRSYVGIGDLRRFESAAGIQGSSRSNGGMGDLHRFEGK